MINNKFNSSFKNLDQALTSSESAVAVDIAQPYTASVSTLSDETSSNYVDPKSYPQAPFAYSMAESENVSLSDGSFVYIFTDIVLPGRNGFDLRIQRRYDSNNANLYEMTPEAHTGGVRTAYRDNFHNFRQYGLGYGWSFVLPSVEITPESQRKSYVSYSTILHLEDGRNFVLNGTELQDYTLQDIQVALAVGTLSHPQKSEVTCSYDMTISYKDGRIDHFAKCYDADGKLDRWTLVAREDRFGNAIFYDLTDGGGMTIVDSWGRTLVLKKYGSELHWTSLDLDENMVNIHYIFEPTEWGRRLLSVIDEIGQTTRYTYNDPAQYTAICNIASAEKGDNQTAQISYQLLSKVTHPTGGVTCFEYLPATEPLSIVVNDIGGIKRYFPLKRRYDKYSDAANAAERDIICYEYSLSSDGNFISCTTVTRGDAIREEHHFNSDAQLLSSRILHDDTSVEETLNVYGTDETAPDYKQLKRQTLVRFYDGLQQKKTIITTYTEDKLRNIASVSEQYDEYPELNNTVSFVYGNYSQLTEKSYKKDESSIIREKYTLHSELDDKVVEFRCVYENDTLCEKTQYRYGSTDADRYCVVEERRFHDLTADGSSGFYTTRMTYAGMHTHQPSSITQTDLVDADGNALPDITESYTYDTCGNMLTHTDGRGYITHYAYDAGGNLLHTVYPDGSSVAHSYDLQRNYVVMRDENGHRRRAQYTSLGQLDTIYFAWRDYATGADIPLLHMTYDAQNRLESEIVYDATRSTDAVIRRVTSYTYDRFDRVVRKLVTAGSTGEVLRDEHIEYKDIFCPRDNYGRKLSRTVTTLKGNGKTPDLVTASDSDPAGNLLQEWNSDQLKARYVYDILGNRIGISDLSGATVTNTYDHAGRLLTTSTDADGLLRSSEKSYDPLGRLIYQTDYENAVTTFVYDAIGRLLRTSSPVGDETAEEWFAYDAAGNQTRHCIKCRDTVKVTGAVYDARNRVGEEYRYANAACTGYSKVIFGYDAVGNKVSVCTGVDETGTGGVERRYTYDRFGNILTAIDPLGQKETNTYDASGRLIRSVSRAGVDTAYTYDGLDRVIERHAVVRNALGTVEDTEVMCYAPTGALLEKSLIHIQGNSTVTRTTAYTYDGYGQLIRQKDPESSKRYAYDVRGLKREFWLYYDHAPCAVQRLWYNYNQMGQLVQVIDRQNGNQILATYTYDKNGRRIRTILANGTVTNYTYNEQGAVTNLHSERDGATLTNFAYTYDLDGSCLSKTDAADVTVSYEYDNLSQLIRETDPSHSIYTYTYDARGNRTRKQTLANGNEAVLTSTDYTYDACDRLLTETTVTPDGCEEHFIYAYDADGNQISKTRQHRRPAAEGFAETLNFNLSETPPRTARLDTRVYDAFGRLLQLTRDSLVVSYTYRPDGLRHSKAVRTTANRKRKETLHLWDGQNIVAEILPERNLSLQFPPEDGVSEPETRTVSVRSKAVYIRGNELICQKIGEECFFYLHNAHGDVVHRISAAGDLAPEYEYDAFGEQYQTASTANDGLDTDPNPFRYCGEYFDAYTQEYYLRNRDYNAHTGRFTQEDPIRSCFNAYSYCDANPLNLFDPLGLLPHGNRSFTYVNDGGSAGSTYEYKARRASVAMQRKNEIAQQIADDPVNRSVAKQGGEILVVPGAPKSITESSQPYIPTRSMRKTPVPVINEDFKLIGTSTTIEEITNEVSKKIAMVRYTRGRMVSQIIADDAWFISNYTYSAGCKTPTSYDISYNTPDGFSATIEFSLSGKKMFMSGYSSNHSMAELAVGGSKAGSLIGELSYGIQVPDKPGSYIITYHEIEVDTKNLARSAVGVAAIGVGCRVMSNVGSSYVYGPMLFGAWNTSALAKSHAW